MLAADWSTLLDKGPYSLLFLDSGEPTQVTVDAIADLVEAGGIVVLDDFAARSGRRSPAAGSTPSRGTG